MRLLSRLGISSRRYAAGKIISSWTIAFYRFLLTSSGIRMASTQWHRHATNRARCTRVTRRFGKGHQRGGGRWASLSSIVTGVFNLRENGLRCVSPAARRASNPSTRPYVRDLRSSQSINPAFLAVRCFFPRLSVLEVRRLWDYHLATTNLRSFFPSLFALPRFLSLAPRFASFSPRRFLAWRLIRSAKPHPARGARGEEKHSDYKDNKLTHTTLSSRIIHHGLTWTWLARLEAATCTLREADPCAFAH